METGEQASQDVVPGPCPPGASRTARGASGYLCHCPARSGVEQVLTAFSLFHYQQEGPEAEMENPDRLPPDRTAVDGEQPSPSFMSTAWLVFKTFFASLLPEGPPAIAN